MWTPEPFEAEDGSVPFERFISKLSDFKLVALDAAIRLVLAARGLDLVRTQWLKPLGEGLYEFRVRHSRDEIQQMFGGSAPRRGGRPENVLLRAFVHFYGDRVILLLGGYDKGRDPSKRRQEREIKRARRYLKQFKQRTARRNGG